MLLGKRTRPPIKRTTSMTVITVDVDVLSNVDDNNIVQQPILMSNDDPKNHPLHELPNANFAYDQRFLAMVSPRSPGGSGGGSYQVLESTTTFLRSCCLCKRRLTPGRDIYMYRGDTAFCSLECREKQMKRDERKEKSNVLASNKQVRHAQAY